MSNLNSHPILSIVNGLLVDLPAPANLTYLWGYGSLLGLCLIIQIATGIFLAMHYAAHIDLAFNSVEHIMRDVSSGWLLSYCHANGASFFFICVFMHIGSGIYYGSYAKPSEAVWSVGVILLIVMMATAFIGYVLVWGMMSYWGATVITNLISAIPFVGIDIVEFVWGGFSIGNATLNRFYSLHYLMPFVIAALAMVHLILLHEDGSNNPMGVEADADKVPFHPYYSVNDLFGYSVFGVAYAGIVYYEPNLLGHPDNYIPANPLVTPAHIQPEWYFLFAYAILRSIPNKLLGVLALFGSLLVLLVIPHIEQSQVSSKQFSPLSNMLFWVLVADFVILTIVGGQVVEEPYVTIGQIASVVYFGYFIVLNPLIGSLENRLVSNQ